MMFTSGFSQARRNRRVISARGWSKCECTDATQTSNPARISSGQSTVPSGPMFSSVPCSRVMTGPPSPASRASSAAELISLRQHLL